ncbi:MAG TPA: PrsW family intramembrane metalloprotease [Longimicrobium sp.]|nr:PrsW family intramembrane metalloprotease [Longimicrobium sp.]
MDALHPAGHPPDASPAPGPPGRPQPHRILMRGAAVCGVLSLLVIAAELGPASFALGMALAVVPVPVYVALALWLDRFEPEPALTLAQTFVWGATVAVFLSLLFNTFADAVTAGVLGPEAAEVFGSVVMAPVIEELAKGLALLFLYSELHDEFDGVVDGVVYAAMVGLGFAMIENVQYYGAAFEEGVESPTLTFVVRGIAAPFAHPLFTSMYGIGLGWVRENHGRVSRALAPTLGLAAAVVLHSLWNLSASFTDWFTLLYGAIMVPAFLGVIALIHLSLKREGRILREHLASLVDDGVIDAAELDCLCGVRRRLRASLRAWRQGGVARWRERREMHRIASELAFHRWRVLRGITLGPDGDARREAEYLHRLRQLCRGREM